MYIYIIHYSINCIYKILQTLLRIVFGGLLQKSLISRSKPPVDALGLSTEAGPPSPEGNQRWWMSANPWGNHRITKLVMDVSRELWVGECFFGAKLDHSMSFYVILHVAGRGSNYWSKMIQWMADDPQGLDDVRRKIADSTRIAIIPFWGSKWWNWWFLAEKSGRKSGRNFLSHHSHPGPSNFRKWLWKNRG